MGGLTLFGYTVMTFLGLLWVKRVSRGKLRCNIFSAAIVSAIFVGINLAFGYLMIVIYHQTSDALKLAYFLFMALGLVPVASIMSLFLGNMLIPFFTIKPPNIMPCTVYLTAWTFLVLILVSIFQILGFLLMGLFFGGSMPRAITRVSDDEYYYH